MRRTRMVRAIVAGCVLCTGTAWALLQPGCNGEWLPVDMGGLPVADLAVPPDLAPTSDMANASLTLSLVAGGLGGVRSLDGTGTAARFKSPVGAALDGNGNLYIADAGEPTIRKIVLSTGAVTTVAGSALEPGSINGASAVARFRAPSALAVDSAGNLYVADTGNHTIRKVVLTTGVVTTLAGGAGSSGKLDGTGVSARFNAPGAVAVDNIGNLYVADTSNHAIRKIVTATGVVTTLAGSGVLGSADGTGSAASFNLPQGAAVDASGDLLVADTNNHTIRKISAATGSVQTVAGSAGMNGTADGTGAAARFNAPRGICVAPSGDVLISDSSNHTLRTWVVATGAVTTLAGAAGMQGSGDGTGTAARFFLPQGLAADSSGNLFVAEPGNQTIRKFAMATGVVTTLAGLANAYGSADGIGTAARFAGPQGLALDNRGNVFVADQVGGTIRQVTPGSGQVTTLAGSPGMFGSTDGKGASARFRSPTGIAADTNAQIFIADNADHTIRKVIVDTGAVTTLAGSAGMAGSADGVSGAAAFNGPYAVAADANGNLYVSDQGNHTIRKVVVPTGAVTTLAGAAGQPGNTDGPGTAARFKGPTGLALDGSGNLFVADWGNHTIRKVIVATGAVSALAGQVMAAGFADGTGSAARFNAPLGLAFDGRGNLLVADAGNHAIRKVAVATGTVTTLAGTLALVGVAPGRLPAALNVPAGVAIAPTGDIYLTDSKEQVVLMIR